MPKTGEKKKIEPTYPPINWLRAAMIDRKNQLKMSWDDIGEAVGTTGGALRQLMYSTPDPWDWPQYTRQKVCRVLGVETRQYVVGSPEDPCR